MAMPERSPHDTHPVCYRHPDRPTRLRCSECGKPICVECSIDGPVGQKCPDCAAHQGRGQYVDARRRVGATGGAFAAAPVSMGIIVVAVIIHLLRLGSTDFNATVFENGAQANWLVADGEWWRVFSAMFLHSTRSFMHILFNMYALYLFGPALERRVGSIPFAAMYLASGAAGGALFFLLGDIRAVAVGASGAIFGLFGAWMFVSWKTRFTPAGRAQFQRLAVLLAINAALPLISSGIAWEAHLGGFVAGVAIAAGWSQFAVGRANARQVRTGIAGAVGAVALLLVLFL